MLKREMIQSTASQVELDEGVGEAVLEVDEVELTEVVIDEKVVIDELEGKD